MQVFKVYFKVIRHNRIQLMIYVVIFLLMTVIVSSMYTATMTSQATAFTAAKPNAAVVSLDGETPLVKGFIEFFGEHASLQTVSPEGDALKDALFFHAVEYAVKIPQGFTRAFLNGEDAALETAGAQDSVNGVLLRTLADRYFATAGLYAKFGGNLTQEEIVRLTRRDLSLSAGLRMESAAPAAQDEGVYLYVFNYISYSLLAVLILGVTSFMLTFNETDLRRRNMCAPIPSFHMNMQMFLANIVFGIVCWALMAGMGFVLYFRDMATPAGLMLLLNSFVFTISCLGISFLLGTLIKKRAAQAPLQNTLTLAFSFLGGAFVPQFLMGKTVLTIASFTPTYWYIKSNHLIVSLHDFSMASLAPVFGNMAVLLGFGAAFLLVALAIAKKRSAGAAA